jgi:ubiquinone/menaquinone biosynthesis C-methylase UbiE
MTTIEAPADHAADEPDVAEHNLEVFAQVTGSYMSKALDASELWLLQRLRARWHEVDMLDLGVGAGRTAFTFSAICRTYVGLDPLEEMLALCRARVGESERVRFVRGDARDLRGVGGSGFDVVLFSCNGIDALNHDDRVRVLREVAKVLKPGGVFFFSAHNLRGYPPMPDPVRFNPRDPIRSLYRRWEHDRYVRRLRREAARSDLARARVQGWMSLRDGAQDFQILNFYIDPQVQLEELQREGFVVDATVDWSGAPVRVADVTTTPNLSYCCRHAGALREGKPITAV